MLETPLRMMDVSTDYFPKGRDWHRYMARVTKEASLNVEYGVHVDSIAIDGSPCVNIQGGTMRCARRRVFVGTGLREKKQLFLEALGGIPYSRMKKELALDRRACILGNGNSGFEVAQNVFNVAEPVVLYGRHPLRLSSVARYTGDVRVKFLQVLENINGKLLDTVDYFMAMPTVDGLDNILNTSQLSMVKELLRTAAWLDEFDCEIFVITTGFESHVPGLSLESRFPSMGDWYSSTDNPSVHYIGWLMHKGDFRKGAGGFFSGYRYLIRNLVHHVREADYGVPYPYDVLTKEEVIARAIARFQVADDLIILQDGVVIKDVIVKVPQESDASDEDMYHYYEGITYDFHSEFRNRDDVISLYFAWGGGRTVQNVFDAVYRWSDSNVLINLFLHPVVEVGDLVRNIHEDVEMTWVDPAYVSVMDKAVRSALDGDVSLFRPKKSYPYQRSVINQTEPPDYYEMAPLKSGVAREVIQALWKAVYRGGARRELNDLRAATKQWLPALFQFDETAQLS